MRFSFSFLLLLAAVDSAQALTISTRHFPHPDLAAGAAAGLPAESSQAAAGYRKHDLRKRWRRKRHWHSSSSITNLPSSIGDVGSVGDLIQKANDILPGVVPQNLDQIVPGVGTQVNAPTIPGAKIQVVSQGGSQQGDSGTQQGGSQPPAQGQDNPPVQVARSTVIKTVVAHATPVPQSGSSDSGGSTGVNSDTDSGPASRHGRIGDVPSSSGTGGSAGGDGSGSSGSGDGGGSGGDVPANIPVIVQPGSTNPGTTNPGGTDSGVTGSISTGSGGTGSGSTGSGTSSSIGVDASITGSIATGGGTCGSCDTGGDNSFLATFNKLRPQWDTDEKFTPYTWSAELANNCQQAVNANSDGAPLVHHMNPGTMGQVLASGQPDFATALADWMCEIPKGSSICTKGQTGGGQTGHAEIIANKQYKSVGCAQNSKVWGCDFA